MDFKKLFRKDDKAVSPVIGVILMVAITVILAAAIGSSVFSKGTTESAPQANFDIKAVPGADAADEDSVRFEHLGGDLVHFGDNSTTKVMSSVDGADATPINATSLGDFGVGDIQKISIGKVNDNQIVNIKIIDVQTNQLICDKDVRF